MYSIEVRLIEIQLLFVVGVSTLLRRGGREKEKGGRDRRREGEKERVGNASGNYHYAAIAV